MKNALQKIWSQKSVEKQQQTWSFSKPLWTFEVPDHPIPDVFSSAAKHPQNPVLIYGLSTRIGTCIVSLRWILDFMASWSRTDMLSAHGQRNKWWLLPKTVRFVNVFDLKFSKRSKFLNALWGKKRVGQRKLSSICVFAYC